MFGGLFVAALIGSCMHAVKECFEPTIPAENWGNTELYDRDIMACVPVEQRMKNLKSGKYRLVRKHPEPHRNPVTGQIIIENYLLFEEDERVYGVQQAYKWVREGKYNLTPEELEQEDKRIAAKYEYLFSL